MAVICIVLGIYASIRFHDFMCLSRAGAVVVGIGIVALSRTFILKKDLLLSVGSGEPGNLNLNGPEYYQAKGKPVPAYVQEDLRSRFALGVVGPVLSFVGSLIWAFADLLNKFFAGFGSACA